MFSGLIAYLGRVSHIAGNGRDGVALAVESPEAIADGIAVKDSIAVNGVCLTAVSVDDRIITFDVVPETVLRSTFSELVLNDPVNLELSLRLGDRLGGHLVYGHVDSIARILDKQSEGQGHRLTIATPAAITSFIVEKGYITVDGVSLTVASVAPGRFTIALIPETSRRTTLGSKGASAAVNLEVDPIARYAQAAISAYTQNGASHEELEWAYEI